MKLHMRSLVLSIMILIAASTAASAQVLTDACKPAGGPFTVTAGKAPAVTWVQPAVSTTAPTVGTIDGFSFVLDAAAAVDFVPTQAGTGPCAADTAQAGATPYVFQLPVTVGKGTHTLRLIAYMFARSVDAAGNVVIDKTARVAFPSTDVPFVAADPLPASPSRPKNIKVWKK